MRGRPGSRGNELIHRREQKKDREKLAGNVIIGYFSTPLSKKKGPSVETD